METINDVFANAVKRFPERQAPIEPTDESGSGKGAMTTLTYTQLQQRVYSFAGHLQEQHFEKRGSPADLVGQPHKLDDRLPGNAARRWGGGPPGCE